MKTLLVSLALLTTTFLAKAQAPTTQEEYNYATKGLKIQRASGLDIKVGYDLMNSTQYKFGTFTITIEDLMRKADGSLACTVVEVSSTHYNYAGEMIYLCIPNPKTVNDVSTQASQAPQFYAVDFQKAVNFALASRVAYITNSFYNKK